MKLELSLEQIEQLLNDQKSLCRNQFEKAWRESEMLNQIRKLDPEEKIINKMYEVRDPISLAEYPSDFLILKKYLTK